MKKIALKTYGKLNLSLGITGVRKDGYHLLDMMMQSVSLCDILTIEKTNSEGVTLSCSDPSLPCDNKNIAYRAYEKFVDALQKKGRGPFGVHIDIEKNIPHGGGMGGGSANAAGVLVGLNTLCETPFSTTELCEIGLALGADVPFCIKGGTMRVQGIGEVLTPLPKLYGVYFVIAKPQKSVSTAKAYSDYDNCEKGIAVDNEKLIQALDTKDLDMFTKNMGNALEEAVDLKEIDTLKEQLEKTGAQKAMMTGSGSCVFGLFTGLKEAKQSAETLRQFAPFVTVATPVQTGVEITGTQ